MTVITPLFREIVIKYDFKIDPRILEKLLSGKGTIHHNTAIKILKEVQEVTGEKYILKDLFYLNELKGFERERVVVVEGMEKMTDEDYISIVRYMIEGKWEP